MVQEFGGVGFMIARLVGVEGVLCVWLELHQSFDFWKYGSRVNNGDCLMMLLAERIRSVL